MKTDHAAVEPSWSKAQRHARVRASWADPGLQASGSSLLRRRCPVTMRPMSDAAQLADAKLAFHIWSHRRRYSNDECGANEAVRAPHP